MTVNERKNTDILKIVDIMDRYKCSNETAIDIVRQLPSFMIGTNTFVKLRDLQNFEERIMRYPGGNGVEE